VPEKSRAAKNRELAANARDFAAALSDPASKEAMLDIARRYEALALLAEGQMAELRVAQPAKGKG
jgi:hypothetical protein